jgi:putative NADPH-quinone reductase
VRTLLVHCHPDPESFTTVVRDKAVATLRQRGDEVRITDLYATGFNPVLSAEERARHLEPGPDPSVAGHAADLQWCERLVLVYPTWWSGQPAMLKGWIDRVWVRDVAFDLPSDSHRVPPAGEDDVDRPLRDRHGDRSAAGGVPRPGRQEARMTRP